MEQGILAVDPGNDTGWATYDPEDQVVRSGHFKIPPSSCLPGKRLYFLQCKLREIAASHHILCDASEPIHVLATELPHNLRGRGTFLLHYVAAIQLLSEELKLAYCHRSPPQIKKWATGNGNATKREILNFARAIYNIPRTKILTHDEADALCLLGLVMNEKGKRKIPPYDEEPTSSSSSSSSSSCREIHLDE